MSFDVYIQWFHDGDSQGLPEERVRSAFGDALKVQDDFGWRLSYGPGLESDVYVSRRDGKVEGLTVNRPAEAPALWQALFDFLGVENAVFFFPGSGLFIRSIAVVRHLPPEMVEALGPPRVVSSAAALRHTLDAA